MWGRMNNPRDTRTGVLGRCILGESDQDRPFREGVVGRRSEGEIVRIVRRAPVAMREDNTQHAPGLTKVFHAA